MMHLLVSEPCVSHWRYKDLGNMVYTSAQYSEIGIMNAKGLDRITLDPEIMGGKPTIRDTRVTVGTILGLLASGCTEKKILEEYPYLESLDIKQALEFAAWRMSEEIEFPFKSA